jgi:hypothetical protein
MKEKVVLLKITTLTMVGGGKQNNIEFNIIKFAGSIFAMEDTHRCHTPSGDMSQTQPRVPPRM